MTPRLAAADEDAIVAAAEARASARRQLDAEALVAARLAELRAGTGGNRRRLIGRHQLANGRLIQWGWEGYHQQRVLVCYLLSTDHLHRKEIGQVGKERDERMRPRGWRAIFYEGGRETKASPEEAMVWLEQQIGK